MDIRIDDLTGPEIAAFLAEHISDMRSVSPPESKHALDLDGLRKPDITFWTVWDNGMLVGCGAIKELDARHGEIKSMRTSAMHRRKGVATFVLRHILREASTRGYQRVSLETGSMPFFEAARQLYRSYGFQDTGPFADYRPDPNSVFMTKDLTTPMTVNDLLILNLEEVRRRSMKIWQAIPPDRNGWRPDDEAMTCIESVRHVLEGEYLYVTMLRNGGSLESEESPWTSRPMTSIESEMEFAAPYRKEFLDLLRAYRPEQLSTMKVDRSDKGYVRGAADFILRMAYHEAVHAGQMLGYLRMMNVPRPDIWD